jgi:catechol 2,3-dioxygenase-like lactoylglutathione lyase family enzyme
MSEISGLDHVQVAAPPGREDEARRFYGELVGLEKLRKPPLLTPCGGVWFSVGVHELHVGVAEDFTPAAKAHPSPRQALGELARRLETSGVEVTWADPAEIPGTSRFHVLDPWGNRLELVARDEAGANT